jgi:hypothetical protein
MNSHLSVGLPIFAALASLGLALCVEGWARRFMRYWFPKKPYQPGPFVKGYKFLRLGGSVFFVLGAIYAFVHG